MKTVAGIFASREAAARAIQRLRGIGVRDEAINVLAPGMSERDIEARVPTDHGEQPGMGTAIGAVAGAATGASIGLPIGAAIATFVIPGVGPIIAAGLLGAALFGAGGAAIGSALEKNLSQGVPRDDLFIYEDALRQGRSVVVALTDDAAAAERAREALREAGGIDVDTARDEWWAGLRDQDRGVYTVDEETQYRRGFELALMGDAREPAPDADAAFRRGWERGRAHRSGAGLRKSA